MRVGNPDSTLSSVYSMCMARVNVYLPDELAEQARRAGLNVSGVAQEALRRELDRDLSDRWIADVSHLAPLEIDNDEVVAAVEAGRDELGSWGG